MVLEVNQSKPSPTEAEIHCSEHQVRILSTKHQRTREKLWLLPAFNANKIHLIWGKNKIKKDLLSPVPAI